MGGARDITVDIGGFDVSMIDPATSDVLHFIHYKDLETVTFEVKFSYLLKVCEISSTNNYKLMFWVVLLS